MQALFLGWVGDRIVFADVLQIGFGPKPITELLKLWGPNVSNIDRCTVYLVRDGRVELMGGGGTGDN